jgi:hypothetical protein
MTAIRFLVRPIPMSVLSLLFATGVAAAMLVYLDNPDLCSVKAINRGAEIKDAAVAVLTGGTVVLILLAAVSLWKPERRERWLAAILLVGIAILGAGVALVAVDSATYVAQMRGYFVGPCTGTWTRHLGYLYFLWGVPLVVLVVQAYRQLGRATRRSITP